MSSPGGSASQQKFTEWKWHPETQSNRRWDTIRGEFQHDRDIPRSAPLTTNEAVLSRTRLDSNPSNPSNSSRDAYTTAEQVGAGLTVSNPSAESNDYRRRKRGFFTRWKVICIQHAANSTAGGNTALSSYESYTQQGERVSSRLQRFVIIQEGRENEEFCYALQISSYGGQGLRGSDLLKEHHGIVYTGNVEPKPDPGELPVRNEKPMRPNAIRIKAHRPDEKLHPMSRINYRNIFRISLFSEVYDFGYVHKNSESWLLIQHQNVVNPNPGSEDRPSAGPSGTRARRADDGGGAGISYRPDAPIERQAPRSSGQPQGQMDMATEASLAQAAYQRMMDQGKTHEQAVALIAQSLQAKNPRLSSAEALAGARGRLNFRGT